MGGEHLITLTTITYPTQKAEEEEEDNGRVNARELVMKRTNKYKEQTLGRSQLTSVRFVPIAFC